MGQFIDTIPTWLLAILICGGAVLVTTMAQVTLHRRWPVESRKPLNELAGFIIAVVGVVYAVLLASIAIFAIERYDRAEQTVEAEAGLISDLYRDAIGLPQPLRGEIRKLLFDYSESVIPDEWPGMEAGQPLRSGWQDGAWIELQTMLRSFSTFQPQSDSERAFLQEMLSRANDLIDARRERLFIGDAASSRSSGGWSSSAASARSGWPSSSAFRTCRAISWSPTSSLSLSASSFS